MAPIILIRMAGVPFDELEKLATPETAATARNLATRQDEFAAAKSAVEKILNSRQHNLSREQFRGWRAAVRSGIMPAAADPPTAAFAHCWQSAADLTAAETALQESLPRELERARISLRDSAAKYLPDYLVFAAEGVRELLAEIKKWEPSEPLAPRKKSTRNRERHLVLYLQRVCGKNDTLSAYGPAGWAKIGAENRVEINPESHFARRETFLERWTAHGAAAAMNADENVRPELAPRLHPNGRIEGDRFVFAESGEILPLDEATLQLLQKCDGRNPAYSLGVDRACLTDLAEKKILRWEIEVPALEPYALNVLLGDVARWRDNATRAAWLGHLQPIAAFPKKFAETRATDARLTIMDDAAARLEELGAEKTATRFLYSATNPIGEECFRECHFTIGETLLDQVAIKAAPWIDFWRDNYAFISSRVAEGLRGLLEKTPRQNGVVPLPAFMRHCAEAKLALIGPGMIAFAATAFREVKEIFAQTFAARARLPECQFTPEDGDLVRRNFSYPKFDEYTYPSADLQLSARSVEAANRGEFQWILAELHPSAALLHHGFYWSNPDKPGLTDALMKTAFNRPSFQFGYTAADFTATTAVQFFDGLPDLTYFVATQRGDPKWKTVPPAETEVFIDDQSGDVGLRRRGSHEYLGSFARGWIIPLGFHPFNFSLGRNTPRLLSGNIVVQRRAWTIAREELGDGDFTGVSRDLVVAVERLRARRDLSRHIYIRPTENALRRSGGEGRDKDTKPVYVDLESYLFLEIFHRWLMKAGEIEATEMLPDPEHLLWQEESGRRTFELRTQIIPR